MFKKKTVFVLGAGAGVDIDMPTGAQLVTQISNKVNIRFEGGRSLIAGDPKTYRAIEALHLCRSQAE